MQYIKLILIAISIAAFIWLAVGVWIVGLIGFIVWRIIANVRWKIKRRLLRRKWELAKI